MKLRNIFSLVIFETLILAACSDIDNMTKEGGELTGEQQNATTMAIPSRVEAAVQGMYTTMYKPCTVFGTSGSRADDMGYPSVCLFNDCNGPDMVCANSAMNWFVYSSDYSDRLVNYAACYIHFYLFYHQVKLADDIIKTIDPATTNATLRNYLGQALAVRAFDYIELAPSYQFRYATSADSACVPIVTDKTTSSAVPRSTVAQVYNQILSDLDSAIVLLKDYNRTDKTCIDLSVAYGLRARAYLAMAKYAEAAANADSAIQISSATPASIEDVASPVFCNLNEKNWMWGSSLQTSFLGGDQVTYATPASNLSSFSGNGYCAFSNVYKCINPLLYNKIPASDIRKTWWLNADTTSTMMANLTWDDGNGHKVSGQSIVNYTYDSKRPMGPYVNLKFGMKTNIGSSINTSDYPFMRIEEMYLIKAEGLAMSGHEGEAKNLLQTFIQTYRDPQYICKATTPEALQTEIWFQRRVEFWGEGFSMSDIMRLGKPVVRFHAGTADNWPNAFRFNIAPNDYCLLMRFPLEESNYNFSIPISAGNNRGTLPISGQNGDLRDGVTD